MKRKDFFEELTRHMCHPDALRKIQRAYWLSKEAHRAQTRDGGERYFEHPREVAITLIRRQYLHSDTICAALLHDCVEDTFVPADVYVSLFGMQVWKWIERLSKKIPHHDQVTGQVIGYVKKATDGYFEQLHSLPVEGRVIKCADRLHNLSTAHVMDPERKARYIKETRERILPLADTTDPWFAARIRQEVKRLESPCETSTAPSP